LIHSYKQEKAQLLTGPNYEQQPLIEEIKGRPGN